MSILTYILGLPLLAALLLVFVPRNFRVIVRAVALAATLVTMLLALKTFCQFVTGQAGYQFEQQISWVESLGISYHVGADGLNVGLILMGAIVAFASACCSWGSPSWPTPPARCTPARCWTAWASSCAAVCRLGVPANTAWSPVA